MQQLAKLEKSGKYVFHGSGEKISIFEPRQAYDFTSGKKKKDDKPAIHASPRIDIACFMGLINKQNCPNGSYSSFHYDNGLVSLQATRESLEQLKKPVGYVYVFNKSDFKHRNPIEYVAYEKLKPLKTIKIGVNELPNNIETIHDPKKEVSISLCMIVMNEEKFLAKALENVRPYVHELIIVDGGSTDKTVEIAKRFGAKVFQRKWNDNYGSQRNHSLSKATKEWVLVMDADETYETKLLLSLQKFAKNRMGIDMFAFPRKNYLDGKQTSSYPDRQYRFFKNIKSIRYKGRMHEKPEGFQFEACARFVNIIHKKSSKRQAKQTAYYKRLANKYNIEPAKSFYAKQLKPGLPFTKK
jgi:hypothetical protein